MSFLAPLFLFGSLAVALPVVFHLIRRTTRERTPFSSLMFLLPTPPRLTRRSRLEHFVLLALRCLVICLLALGFARPFFKMSVPPPPPSKARRILLLVDRSASMQRAGLWPDARDKVRAIARGATPSDQVALFLFDDRVTPLVSFDQWNSTPITERSALLEAKLAQSGPGWSSTRLDSALIQAAETLADPGGKPAPGSGEVVLISDLQEGSHLEHLQGYEWPRTTRLSIEPLKPRHRGNASIQLVGDPERGGLSSATVRVRVANATDSSTEQLQVGWAGASGADFARPPMEVYVPPGQSRVVAVPVPPGSPPLNRVLLRGDDEGFDNVAFTLPPERTRLKVVYLGSESASDSKQPLYFLKRALQDTPQQVVEIQAHSPSAAGSAAEFQNASLIIVADPLPPGLAEAVREQVLSGRTCLCLAKNEAISSTLAKLAGVTQVSADEAPLDKYAMLTDIDFRDPLFAPFADPRFSDFTKVHFWKYRRMDAASLPGSRVLAKFDGGDPALLDLPVGPGHVLVLTSGWQPEDSQLALSTKFVPLLYSILERSGVQMAAPTTYRVGDTVSLGGPDNHDASGSARKILTPAGTLEELEADQTNFTDTLAPGIYTVISGQSSNRFAVNLDAAESRTTPLSIEEFERLGAPLSEQPTNVKLATEAKARLQNSELEGRQKLWRWLILVVLAFLLGETWLAGRATHRTVAPLEMAGDVGGGTS